MQQPQQRVEAEAAEVARPCAAVSGARPIFHPLEQEEQEDPPAVAASRLPPRRCRHAPRQSCDPHRRPRLSPTGGRTRGAHRRARRVAPHHGGYRDWDWGQVAGSLLSMPPPAPPPPPPLEARRAATASQTRSCRPPQRRRRHRSCRPRARRPRTSAGCGAAHAAHSRPRRRPSAHTRPIFYSSPRPRAAPRAPQEEPPEQPEQLEEEQEEEEEEEGLPSATA